QACPAQCEERNRASASRCCAPPYRPPSSFLLGSGRERSMVSVRFLCLGSRLLPVKSERRKFGASRVPFFNRASNWSSGCLEDRTKTAALSNPVQTASNSDRSILQDCRIGRS